MYAFDDKTPARSVKRASTAGKAGLHLGLLESMPSISLLNAFYLTFGDIN
jgi:hypothetical protein